MICTFYSTCYLLIPFPQGTAGGAQGGKTTMDQCLESFLFVQLAFTALTKRTGPRLTWHKNLEPIIMVYESQAGEKPKRFSNVWVVYALIP